MLLLVIAFSLESTFEAFAVLQIMIWQFEKAPSVQTANCNAMTFYIPICVFLYEFLIIPLRQSRSTFHKTGSFYIPTRVCFTISHRLFFSHRCFNQLGDGWHYGRPATRQTPTNPHHYSLLTFPPLLITAHRATSTKPTSDLIHSPLLAARSPDAGTFSPSEIGATPRPSCGGGAPTVIPLADARGGRANSARSLPRRQQVA